MYAISNEMNARLEKEFKYHSPKADQPERYTKLREKAKELAFLIAVLTPQSREQSTALTTLKDCVMWANAAIAINESSNPAENSNSIQDRTGQSVLSAPHGVDYIVEPK